MIKRNPILITLLAGVVALSGLAYKLSLPYPLRPFLTRTSPQPLAVPVKGDAGAHPVAHPVAVSPAPKTPDLSHWKCTWKEVERGDPKSKEVALTFDADWSAQYTLPIITALKAHHDCATFFITGHFCRKFPAETLALAQANMEIGSHSDTHPHFVKLDKKEIQEQLDHSEASFQERFGHGTKPLFRFPYGESDKQSRVAVAADGFQPIYWSLDSLDSFGKEKSAKFIKKRILPRVKAGDIILMHVSSKGSAEALPSILTALEKRGLKVVPISEFMKSG